MRCKACNELLSDYETSIRSIRTRDFVSLCKHCLESIKTDVLAIGNPRLMTDNDEINEAIPDDSDDLDSLFDNPQEDH